MTIPAKRPVHVNNCTSLIFLLQGLRYKDYHVVAAPAPIQPPAPIPTKSLSYFSPSVKDIDGTWSFEEFDTVKEFGKQMEERGVLEWWRKAMDFTS
jgi:hypothetical protein